MIISSHLKSALIVLLSLSLSACGFHLRSADELPPQLHKLCLKTPNPYNGFTVKLRNLLRSLGLSVEPSCKDSPYRLTVYSINLTRDNPNITDANQAVSFTYTLNVEFDLKNSKDQVILSKRVLTANRVVILNSQQIYTSYNTGTIQNQLEQIVANQVFEQLITLESKKQFERFP